MREHESEHDEYRVDDSGLYSNLFGYLGKTGQFRIRLRNHVIGSSVPQEDSIALNQFVAFGRQSHFVSFRVTLMDRISRKDEAAFRAH